MHFGGEATFASWTQSCLKKSLLHCCLVLLFYSALYVAFFSPVLFSDRLLAPGDGGIYYLPTFYSARTFWEPTIQAGFPAAADQQTMTWYPPALFFSLLLNSWNAFIVSAYVLASCFAYGYVYSLTRSNLSGIVAGIVYGMSGFMMAHLGHATMIHCALWTPLIIWSFEELRRRLDPGWIAIATGAISCSTLAGHPQILAYTLLLSAAYVLVFGWGAPAGRWRYYGLCLLLTILGTNLAAIQLIPAAELAGLSLRAQLSFADFTTYAVPLRQLPTLLFPLLFGGSPGSFYGKPYFGEWVSGTGGWGLTELTGYIGLLPLMLAAVGLIAWERRLLSIFWSGTGLLAFLLTLGTATPLAALAYHIPVVNLFRAPGRHFVEVALATSVLAGLGVAALERMTTHRLVWRIGCAGAVVLFGCLIVLLPFRDRLHSLAMSRDAGEVSVLPWVNPAVGVPLLIFLVGAGGLIYWHQKPQSFLRRFLLILILILDLASFGWFCEWNYESPGKTLLSAPAFAGKYKGVLENAHQRMLPVRGGLGTLEEIPPNLSRMWEIPSASGYGPMLLSRVSRMLSLAPHGSVDDSWRQANNQSLNLMAIRYIFLPRSEAQPPSKPDERGTTWFTDDWGVSLGAGCGAPQPDSITLDLPNGFTATAIGIVSALACSAEVPDGREVARLTVTDINGVVHTESLLAGRDTSEWAYDCGDVRALVQHQRAPVFRSYPVRREAGPCEGHEFVTRLSLNDGMNVRKVELRWTGPAGSIAIKRMSLINEPARQSLPISPVTGSLADSTRWRHVEDIGDTSVYENLRAMPRAWLVPEVARVTEEEALTAVRSSRMPDGRAYDPLQMALVEEPLVFKRANADPAASAQVVRAAGSHMEVHTSSLSPSFLVLSDVYYPGWRATIDGTPTHLFQTNVSLRGVMVPAGGHVVRLEFVPTSFYRGVVISIVSFLVFVALLFRAGKRKAQPRSGAIQ